MNWPFGKRKVPPLAINRNFYVSVLAGPGGLPPLLQVCNPDGSNGAVQGYSVPLQGGSRDLLSEPISTQSYAFSTRDKKGLLQLDVFDRAQVPFELPASVEQRQDAGLDEASVGRANAARYVGTLTFRGYDEDSFPTIRFFISIATRLANLTQGVVADPLAEVYRLPETWLPPPPRTEPLDFREVARVKAVEMEDGVWVSTRGLAKFNLAEFEMYGLARDQVQRAAVMLAAAGQQCLLGMPIRVGDAPFDTKNRLVAVVGERSSTTWGDRTAIEFRDLGRTGAALGVADWRPPV